MILNSVCVSIYIFYVCLCKLYVNCLISVFLKMCHCNWSRAWLSTADLQGSFVYILRIILICLWWSSFTVKRNFVYGLLSISVPPNSAVLETESHLYLFL